MTDNNNWEPVDDPMPSSAKTETASPDRPRDGKDDARAPSPRSASRSRSPRPRSNSSYARNRSRSPGRGSRDFVSRRAPSSPPKPGNVLGIFGLASETNEADIKKIFTEFGNIESVTLIRDKNTDISRGFGFIYFTDIKDAEAAKEKTNGTVIHGREIRVDFSKTQKPHDPTPGQYLGKSRDYPPRRSTDRYGSRSGDRYEGREERYRYESRPYPPRYSSKDGRRERRPYRSRSRSPKPSYYRRSPPPPAYGSSHERSSAPYDRRDRYQPSRPRSRSPY